MKVSPLFSLTLLGSTAALVPSHLSARPRVIKASRSPLFRNPSFLLSTADETTSSSDDDESSDTTEAVLGEMLVISDDEMAEAKVDIAKNWGFILTTGVADIVAGCAALAAPICATAMAQITQMVALLLTGFTNVLGVFYVEQGLKLRSLLLGLSQIGLGTFFGKHPVETRYIGTLLIASLAFSDGLYRLLLAVQNSDLPERGWTIFGGLTSMAVSVLVTSNLDLASLFTIGAVMGGLFVSAGWTRIFVALKGREDANAKIDPSSS